MAADSDGRTATPAELAGGRATSVRDDPRLIVGLGASAGGLGALRAFFRALPDGHDIAFVVIVHLDPERESSLAELLQSHTSLQVRQVNGTVPLEASHVYVIPPNRSLSVENGCLSLSEFSNPRWQRAPVDIFFRSLAALGDRAVAIVLSGTGTDGTVGVKAVKEAGGVVLVQDPGDAEHDGMPRSALREGYADAVLPAAELAETVVRLVRGADKIRLPEQPERLPESETEALHRILGKLRARTGHDFSRYKRSTLLRRVARRMQMSQVETLRDYQEVLDANPTEPQALLKDLLISVTHFFRDPGAWDEIERVVIPAVLAHRGQEGEVRVWVPGCATGEEAYTMAMLLLHHAGGQEPPSAIQVFASDIDGEALSYGRVGLYPQTIEADVPPAYLRRFFTAEGDHYRVNREVRDRVLFAAHGLFRHPPFSRLDLVSCRNLLIYLERDLQEDALRLFHYALRPEGHLFLGTAESAEMTAELFEPVSTKHRIYRRNRAPAGQPPRIPSLEIQRPVAAYAVGAPREAGHPHRSTTTQHLHLLERLSPPSLVVDRGYGLVHLSESAGRFLVRPGGLPSNDLLREIRPELRLDLQEGLVDAFERGRSTTRGPVTVAFDGQPRRVFLVVRPADGDEDDPKRLALVVLVEAGVAEPAEAEEARAADGDQRVERLREELQQVRERMQTTVEEYESSQEEMKAANEELQSINEEYKSAAEELETSKEELHSVNEELETVNQELKHKIEELSQANSDLQNLMTSTEIGTLFLDRGLRIQRYTAPISRLFNIMPGDLGRPIAHLTHVVEYHELTDDALRVLRDLSPVEREVRGPDGTWYLVRLRPYRTVEDVIEGVVVSFVDITRRWEAEAGLKALTETLEQRVRERTAELRRARDLFYDVFHASPAPMIMSRLDDGRQVDTNQAYRDFLGYQESAFEEGEEGVDPTGLPWVDADQRRMVLDALRAGERVRDVEVRMRTSTGETRTALLFAERIRLEDEPHELSVFIDVSARKRAEQQVRDLASRLTIAEQEERRRMARVLHDDLQQRLYGVRYKLEGIRRAATAEHGVLRELAPLDEIERWLDASIEEMRHLTVDLSPPVLVGEGLSDALPWLVEQMKEAHGLDVLVETNKTHKMRDPEIRILAFQIVRELLFNVVKHAGVSRAEVAFGEEDGVWRIDVRDRGVGFDVAKLQGLSTELASYGLRSLRERISLFGGDLRIESTVGEGTIASVFIPVPRERAS